jgi:hypothetical protein
VIRPYDTGGFEVHDPEFLRLVLPNAALVKLGEGFAWLEGPVWFADPIYTNTRGLARLPSQGSEAR